MRAFTQPQFQSLVEDKSGANLAIGWGTKEKIVYSAGTLGRSHTERDREVSYIYMQLWLR